MKVVVCAFFPFHVLSSPLLETMRMFYHFKTLILVALQPWNCATHPSAVIQADGTVGVAWLEQINDRIPKLSCFNPHSIATGFPLMIWVYDCKTLGSVILHADLVSYLLKCCSVTFSQPGIHCGRGLPSFMSTT